MTAANDSNKFMQTPNPEKKVYLGDGVYAELETQWRVKLTTENGIAVTNTIYLDEDVLRAFGDWLNAIAKAAKEAGFA
jgi:hypothetical protein